MPTTSAPTARAQLLKVREATELLNVSRSQVYLLMSSGQLPYVRLPGAGPSPKTRRIPLAGVEALIARSLVSAA
jgi:excisionase family DNA binding protein